MSTSTRLTQVLDTATEIVFDNNDKFILFSDNHRGDNSWADDSAHNQTLMFYALQYYFQEGFTYIEVGDGDELLENADFKALHGAHSHLYWLMSEFHKDKRLYWIYGNHNIQWKNPATVEKLLSHYFDEVTQTERPLFGKIDIVEGLILHHKQTHKRLFITHGHQGDFISETLWPLSLLAVRFIWKPLQLLGVPDPTSPAQNHGKRNRIEQKIVDWAVTHQQPIICGHTHRPVFPNAGQPPYYNTGSGVHPRCITGIEIQNGELALIKWWVRPNAQGVLYIARELLEGPRRIADV